MKRTGFFLVFFISLILSCRCVQTNGSSPLPQGADIVLPEPEASIDVDLMKAYRLRRSIKDFLEKDFGLKDLSTILWAANGINREDGKRTAPSPFALELIDIYVFSNTGIRLYDAKENKLIFLSGENAKHRIGAEAGARGTKTAPHVLLLTADLAKLPDFLDRRVKENTSHATAGTIGQNVYLIAGALGLATRFIGSVNEEGIRGCLELGEDEIPLYVMPLGYKK